MKNSEFIALLIANTNKTKNVRTYGSKWFSGARRIEDNILCRFGHVVALIQGKIDEGYILEDKDKEHLLLYNVQPLYWHDNNTPKNRTPIITRKKEVGGNNTPTITRKKGHENNEEQSLYITIDMVIKPMCEVNNTHTLFGAPLQLAVDVKSGEVMNNTKAMLQMGLILPEDLDPGDEPISYGSFFLYPAICGFVGLSSDTYFSPNDVFSGLLDRSEMVLNACAYDSLTETLEGFRSAKNVFNWVGELKTHKEALPDLVREGISRNILKLISDGIDQIFVTPHPETRAVEARVDDQITRLREASEEPAITTEERVPYYSCGPA